jgi:hypothetical protein
MKRDIGNYDLTGINLKIQKPKNKTIQSDIYINTLTCVAGKGIYSSKFKSIFHKNKYLMAENKKRDYDFPFYLDPISKTSVNNKEAVDKSFQKNANKNNLDNYIKGVLASVVLNDAQKLGELVGYDNRVFFDKSNQIKKDLVDKFKNWQGSISSWEKEKMTTI